MTQIKARCPAQGYGVDMFYLTLILHLFVGATLAGVGIVVVLVAGIAGIWPLVAAGVLGFVAGFPAAWYVARAMQGK